MNNQERYTIIKEELYNLLSLRFKMRMYYMRQRYTIIIIELIMPLLSCILLLLLSFFQVFVVFSSFNDYLIHTSLSFEIDSVLTW